MQYELLQENNTPFPHPLQDVPLYPCAPWWCSTIPRPCLVMVLQSELHLLDSGCCAKPTSTAVLPKQQHFLKASEPPFGHRQSRRWMLYKLEDAIELLFLQWVSVGMPEYPIGEGLVHDSKVPGGPSSRFPEYPILQALSRQQSSSQTSLFWQYHAQSSCEW